MQRLFFCFIHIPKCGGLTFDEILQRNLGNDYLRLPHELYEASIASHNLELYIGESPYRRGIGGHRLSLDLPFSTLREVELKAICFIRDPLARLRSEFFYVKRLPGNIAQRTLIRQYDYPQYLEYFLKNPENLENIAKYQTQYLFGSLRYDFKFIERLINSNQLFLFPLERFDEACLYLEHAFPGHLKDTSYVERNTNQQKDLSDCADLEKELGAKLTEDNNLYQTAQQQLEALILNRFSAGEFENALANFKRRCLIRQYVHDPIQKSFQKLYRLINLW